MMELHPPPLFVVTADWHPHPLAVKSLIVLPPILFLFYGLSYAWRLVCVSVQAEKYFFSETTEIRENSDGNQTLDVDKSLA